MKFNPDFTDIESGEINWRDINGELIGSKNIKNELPYK